jgi:hypothetical protein
VGWGGRCFDVQRRFRSAGHAQPANGAAPAAAPQQGGQSSSQQDYSAEWANYYRSLGKIEEAEAIEKQIAAAKVSRECLLVMAERLMESSCRLAAVALNHNPATPTRALKTWRLISSTSNTAAGTKDNSSISSTPAAIPASRTTPTRIGELTAQRLPLLFLSFPSSLIEQFH